jgi:hypothetical protein
MADVQAGVEVGLEVAEDGRDLVRPGSFSHGSLPGSLPVVRFPLRLDQVLGGRPHRGGHRFSPDWSPDLGRPRIHLSAEKPPGEAALSRPLVIAVACWVGAPSPGPARSRLQIRATTARVEIDRVRAHGSAPVRDLGGGRLKIPRVVEIMSLSRENRPRGRYRRAGPG